MNFEIYSDFGCINLALVVALWPAPTSIWENISKRKNKFICLFGFKIDFCKTYSKGGARRGSNLNEVSK